MLKDMYCILGGGGHTKAIIDNMVNNKMNNIVILDDNLSKNDIILHYYKILGKINRDEISTLLHQCSIDNINIHFICGIGNNKIRYNIVSKIKYEFPTLDWISIIHPTAHVSAFAKIGEGCFIGPHSFIGPDTIIGDHTIINTKSSVDHDCIVGNFCHLAPNTTVCGCVKIGNDVFIGTGATIIDHIEIKNNIIIGSVSNIIRNIEDNCKIYGNPGKVIDSQCL
jgi:sugar O-acyltransferase (sialic acid O-acetyltransferase NeuD family)